MSAGGCQNLIVSVGQGGIGKHFSAARRVGNGRGEFGHTPNQVLYSRSTESQDATTPRPGRIRASVIESET